MGSHKLSSMAKTSTERPSVSPADESSGDAIHSELLRVFEKLKARSILSDPVVRRYYNSLCTILGIPSLEMHQLNAKIGKLREFLSELKPAVAEEPLLLRVVAECQFSLCFCLLEAHHAESFVGRECFEPPAVDSDAFVEAEGLLSEALEVSPDYPGGHMALVDIMLRKARLLSEAEAKESLDAFLREQQGLIAPEWLAYVDLEKAILLDDFTAWARGRRLLPRFDPMMAYRYWRRTQNSAFQKLARFLISQDKRRKEYLSVVALMELEWLESRLTTSIPSVPSEDSCFRGRSHAHGEFHPRDLLKMSQVVKVGQSRTLNIYVRCALSKSLCESLLALVPTKFLVKFTPNYTPKLRYDRCCSGVAV